MWHSHQESKLFNLREELLSLNSDFFSWLIRRREVTENIQIEKKLCGRFKYYDPKREIEVFNLLESALKGASLKELLAFSLIMEDHALASDHNSYPEWSKGVHIHQPRHELFEMMNPLMLKKTHPDLFHKLSLTSDFLFLKDYPLP